MRTYVTESGDTWDAIAYKAYGNELYADRLMSANSDKLAYFVFPSGIELNIPEETSILADEVTTDLPDWRAALNG